jgi:protein tyrosine/serine phosphatase
MQMHLNRNSLRSYPGVLVAVLLLTITAAAQQHDAGQSTTPSNSIKNFGQMDARFYRGAQPKTKQDYEALAAMGIKTVIDLRDDPKEYEKPFVESLGMKYVNIPMITKKYPTEEATQAFLKVVSDPDTGKFFVHCAGGRHRTGAMGAVYRFHFYNWNFEQVYREMKQYDFYTSWGHGAFKDFVEDYYKRVQADKASAQAPAHSQAEASPRTKEQH